MNEWDLGCIYSWNLINRAVALHFCSYLHMYNTMTFRRVTGWPYTAHNVREIKIVGISRSCQSWDGLNLDLIGILLDFWPVWMEGRRRGSEGKRVKLVKNKLILC